VTGKKRGGARRISRWEWVTAAAGLLLVVSAVAILLAQGLGGGRRPPDVVVHADSVAPATRGFRVGFRVVNRGDLTAAAVIVRGTLALDGGVAETSEAQLDYVPGRSEREGGLFFEHDPRRGTLTLRAIGYANP
jgi:uncharacterized protein (TIGR02588 family)